jgi:hypothetical protein
MGGRINVGQAVALVAGDLSCAEDTQHEADALIAASYMLPTVTVQEDNAWRETHHRTPFRPPFWKLPIVCVGWRCRESADSVVVWTASFRVELLA